jgi:hypothetical protein
MMPNRPTFTETAREVGDRVFGSNQHGATYGHGPRYERSDTGTFGYANDRAAAATRHDPEGGDPELPAYSESMSSVGAGCLAQVEPAGFRVDSAEASDDSTTMPLPPPAAYSSPITARHDTRSGSIPATEVGEAPPKYDSAPPIVRTL